MPAFQVSFPGQHNAVDVFETWQVGESTHQPALLVDGASAGSIWRADLPANSLLSAHLIDRIEQDELRVHDALPAARQHLQFDLAMLMSQESAPSFSLPTDLTSDTLHEPRLILASALSYRSPEVSFGLTDALKLAPLQLDAAVQAVHGFTAQVQRTLEQFSLVETNIASRRVAVSRITWDGDMQTYWQTGADPEQFSLHNQVVAQVFATRQNWMDFLLLISSGILRVSVALATAPFSPLTLWTTWNYLQQVIQKIRNKD